MHAGEENDWSEVLKKHRSQCVDMGGEAGQSAEEHGAADSAEEQGFLRWIIAPCGGQRGVTLSHVCPLARDEGVRAHLPLNCVWELLVCALETSANQLGGDSCRCQLMV